MTPFKYYVNSWYKNRLYLGNILYFQIHLTTNCQNHCEHCYFQEIEENQRSFPFNRLLSFLEQIHSRALELRLNPRIDFTGGDPFLYEHLLDALIKCEELHIPYGFKCNPEFFLHPDQIILEHVRRSQGISLSLDGLMDIHDSFRGAGSFANTFQAIEIIKRNGIQLRINTTVSKRNIHQLIPLIRFLLSQEIVLDDYTWARYWSKAHTDDMLTAQDLRDIFDEMTAFMNELFCNASFYIKTLDGKMVPQIMFGFKEHQWFPYLCQRGLIDEDLAKVIMEWPNSINCTATKHFYIADPDGSVYKCRKLISSKVDPWRTEATVLSDNSESQCRHCIYFNGCGGCSAITASYTGNPHLIEPGCPYYTYTTDAL